MNIRHSLLALSALDAARRCFRAILAPVHAAAVRRRRGRPAAQPAGGAVDEPWMAQPAAAVAADSLAIADGPAEQGTRARADRSAAGDRAGRRHDLHRRGARAARGPRQRLRSPASPFAAWSGAPVDLFTSVNPIYTELRRGLVKYRAALGQPAADPDPGGPTLKAGSTGDRVAMLRTRLGLADGDKLRRGARGARSRNSRPSTASRPTGSPAPARSRRSTAAPIITSS